MGKVKHNPKKRINAFAIFAVLGKIHALNIEKQTRIEFNLKLN